MMKWALILGAMISVYACTTGQPNTQKEIAQLEEELKSSSELDTAKAKEVTGLYTEYVKAHPHDSISAEYLVRAADIYKEMPGEALKAINLYNQVLHQFPTHQRTPKATFMIAYVFDENLKDEERAAKAYQHFLKKYPDHALSQEAKNLLALLENNLTDEELVAKWLQQAKADTNKSSK